MLGGVFKVLPRTLKILVWPLGLWLRPAALQYAGIVLVGRGSTGTLVRGLAKKADTETAGCGGRVANGKAP